ncbi:OprO/OprP family phosphate-selective porin, partial [Methylophaga lonarensis]|uniref:OprO/OprP family phosphate-selective porin n=1 Tax=Methylophaga lonarensis TaxID=999151 RepID=UPI003D2CB194
SWADAGSDAERIQKLEQQVNLLLERLSAQESQLNQQQQDISETKAATKGNVIASTNGRSLTFKDADGDFSFTVGGRLQADAVYHNEDDIELGDGSRFRRAFLDIRGTVYRDWNYRFQYDFARPGGSDSSQRGIRDAYIQYTGFTPAVTVGQFKQPFGLEHLTSSLNTTFNERALTNVFNPDRAIGVGLSHGGNNWSLSGGAFGEKAEVDPADEGNEGWGLVARGTFNPIIEKDRLVHLGAAVLHRNPEEGDLRFRERPEANVTGVRFIDTGVISNVDDYQQYGLEAATVLGPFSLQGEYINTRVQRGTGDKNLSFDAWYVYGSYFFTGESRGYNAKSGAFGAVRPNSTVGKGGIGAWEAGIRYSRADLNDGSFIGGDQENLTLGVNWYATDNIRFSANYIKVLDVDRPGNAADGEKPNIFALRGQIHF